MFPPGTIGCGQLAIVTDTTTGTSVTFEVGCARCGSEDAIRLPADAFPDLSPATTMPGERERYSVSRVRYGS
jgi:hypothetical protein